MPLTTSSPSTKTKRCTWRGNQRFTTLDPNARPKRSTQTLPTANEDIYSMYLYHIRADTRRSTKAVRASKTDADSWTVAICLKVPIPTSLMRFWRNLGLGIVDP
ncbi:hypothetical protein EYF80_040843 [Liparis tanakae]|uniref:Uncharacterized protein n=1 Tax=Liparis tanakae TaxID=230148 RepID=A0A4Z2G7P6_9TELE|nr:hypothetical protein EYF80_040843 [Liparis tanakae]